MVSEQGIVGEGGRKALRPYGITGVFVVAVFAGLLAFIHPVLPLLAVGGILFVLLAIRSPFWGLLTIVMLIPFGQFARIPLGQQGAQEIPLMLVDLCIPLLFACWLIRKFTHKQAIKLPPGWAYLAVFTAIASIALLHAAVIFPSKAILVGGLYLIRWIIYSLLFPIAYDTLATETKMRTMLGVWMVSGVLLAILGFIQLILFPDFSFMVDAGWDPHLDRVVSTFFDPNFTGIYLVAALTALLVIWYTREQKVKGKLVRECSPSEYAQGVRQIIRDTLLLCSAGIMGLALLLTYSRSSLLALIIILLIVGLTLDKRILVIGIVVGITALIAFPRIQERFLETFDYQTSAFKRLDSWGNAFTILEQSNPLVGIGYNTYRDAQIHFDIIEEEELARSGAGTDSSILLVAVTTGILGAIVFLGLLLHGIARGVALYRLRVGFGKVFGISFAGLLMALIVHSQFVNSLLYPYILILLWIGFGAIGHSFHPLTKELRENKAKETHKTQLQML